MPEVLAVQSVVHRYGSTPVLDRVSLTVEEGELVSVLGRSGAGKTTLLRAVGGFLTPTHGTIALRGVDVCRDGRRLVAPEKRGLGIVFQDYALFSHLTVAENVGFGLPRRERKGARVDELLSWVGLSAHARKRPAELSGGQQQRVALARALAPRPAMLLLDEPFANLDAALRTDLERELRALLSRTGTAALMITHDRREALSIADRTAVLEPGPDGAIVAQFDTPDSVYHRPASPEVARLTGDAQLVRADANGPNARCDLGELPLVTPTDGPVEVLLRTESFSLTAAADGPARIEARAFLGATVRYEVAMGDHRIEVTAASRPAPLPVGTAVTLRPSAPLHAWTVK